MRRRATEEQRRSPARELVVPARPFDRAKRLEAQPAAGVTGDGFACCGVFKYFLVPRVPAHFSLHAALHVTSGTARAVYLKARTCPAFPNDVSNDACLGQCTVSWLTRFDEYDGSPTSKADTSIVVPNGLGDGCPASCPPDLRHEGDWYIGVQALPGTEAEFALNVSIVEPPYIDRGHQCDPSEPECRAPLDSDALNAHLGEDLQCVRER